MNFAGVKRLVHSRAMRLVAATLVACATHGAVQGADSASFPAAKRAVIDAALTKAFVATKAPGVVVGIWIPGEGSYVAAKGFADIRSQPGACDARRRSLPHRQHHQDLHRDRAADARRREEGRARRSGEQVRRLRAQRRQDHAAHARQHDERLAQLHRGRGVAEDRVQQLQPRVDAARAGRRRPRAQARLRARHRVGTTATPTTCCSA